MNEYQQKIIKNVLQNINSVKCLSKIKQNPVSWFFEIHYKNENAPDIIYSMILSELLIVYDKMKKGFEHGK